MPELYVTFNDELHRISFKPGLTVRAILDGTEVRVRSSCGGVGKCGLCSVRIIDGTANKYTAAEHNKLTFGEREQGLRLSCQLRPTDDLKIAIDKPAVLSSWKSLSAHEYSPAFDRITPLPRASNAIHSYGAAIDLGTTHIRVSLWDLCTGKRCAGRSGRNPQAMFGADVLTRLVKAAESQKNADEMGQLAIDAIGGALLDIATREAIDLKNIDHMVVVGNTPMLSLLTGKNYDRLIQPDYWTKEVDCVPENLSTLSHSWGCKKETNIEVAKPMVGFVGSDLLAAISATRLIEGPAGSLLIDFGTNSEIAMWDGEKLWITSAAGGPAFEGCGISYGMPAEPGAICKVSVQQQGGFAVDVIGGLSPKGICGSGLVDIIACLSRFGQLKKNGRFGHDIGEQGYLVNSEGDGVYLKKGDVDLFQRAKAGIAAGVKCLMKRAAMSIDALQRVCVCGAFGTCLNIENAQAVGLLPAIDSKCVELCGNTALTGCELLLFSAVPGTFLQLKQRAELINMSNDVEFEMQFIQNLYLQPMLDG